MKQIGIQDLKAFINDPLQVVSHNQKLVFEQQIETMQQINNRLLFCYRVKFCFNSVNGNFALTYQSDIECYEKSYDGKHVTASCCTKKFPTKTEKVTVKIMNIRENFKSNVLKLY